MVNDTKILECVCSHDYQDKAFGKQKRVHNKTSKDNEYRCTVCERTRQGK